MSSLSELVAQNKCQMVNKWSIIKALRLHD
jgi:hypothetical protein